MFTYTCRSVPLLLVLQEKVLGLVYLAKYIHVVHNHNHLGILGKRSIELFIRVLLHLHQSKKTLWKEKWYYSRAVLSSRAVYMYRVSVHSSAEQHVSAPCKISTEITLVYITLHKSVV